MHISNGFKSILETRPPKAVDVCCAKASVVAVVNNGDSGKTVRVSRHALFEGNPVVEVHSLFFVRGRFPDYESTLEAIDEPKYTIELVTDAHAGPSVLECNRKITRLPFSSEQMPAVLFAPRERISGVC